MIVEVWLDLEETVIDNWSDGRFKHRNIEKIKKFLVGLAKKPKQLNIWSHAIYDAADKEHFDKFMRESLELELGYLIKEFPSVDEQMNIAKQFENFKYDDRSEFMQFNGKNLSFMKMGFLKQDTTLYLIDDSAMSISINVHKKNVIMHLLNINSDF